MFKTFPQRSTCVRVIILSHRLTTNESLGGIGAQPSTSHAEFRLLIRIFKISKESDYYDS